jgi:glycosyltransferase EpsE
MSAKVSILMGICNCEKTLGPALDSIISQTYENWELIMCDDGSVDRTYELAMEYAVKDKRMTVIRNPENLGLAGTLNRCLGHAEGEYIMRHDGDDLMAHDKIEKQLRVVEDNKCDICGTGAFVFDDSGIWGLRMPDREPEKKCMAKEIPVIHAIVMMRKRILISVNGYSDNRFTRQRLEDYDLWIKFFEKGYIFHNIREPLYYYRVDKHSYKRRKRKFRLSEFRIRLDACKRLDLPFWMRILALKPLVLLFLPYQIVQKLNLKRLEKALHSSNYRVSGVQT